MVQFIPARNTWSDIGERFAGGATEGYMHRSDENALRKSVMDLGENASPRDILNAITNTKTHSKEAKQNVLKNWMGVAEYEQTERKYKADQEIARAKKALEDAKNTRGEEKNKRDEEKFQTEKDEKSQEKVRTKAIVDQLNLPPEQKASLGESLSLDAAEDLLREQLKPKKDSDLTPFQRKVQEKNAEEYIKLATDIPKIESTLGDIDYVRKLSQELGVSGMVTGALGLSEKAKELETVSFTLMEPIVKMFNPSGPIAAQKLKRIQDKYVINATDAPWNKEAKLKALERFAKQALSRAQQKMELIKKYEGNPPDNVVTAFDRESDTISDAMLDYDLQGEEISNPNLPDVKSFKGKTITSPEGQKFYSDGTRWVKK